MSREIHLSSKLKEELLVCGICYNRYTAKVRLPKLLACMHTFCAPCIESCALGDTGAIPTIFACPVCRRETQLNADGTAGLPNNFSLITLIEILQTQRQSPAKSPNDESTSRKCSSPTCSPTSPPDGTTRVVFALSSSEVESSPEGCQQNLRSPMSLPTSPESAECQCAERPPAFNPDYNSDASGGMSVDSNMPHSPSCPLFQRRPANISPQPASKPHTRNAVPPPRPAQPPRTATPPAHTATPPARAATPPARNPQMTSPIRRNFLSASMPFRNRFPTRPQRRSFHRSTSVLEALKCVRKFGHYSDIPMTANAFKKPTKVAISENGEIAILDGIYMAVQLFTSTGEHISMFTVPGASTVCFVGSEKIVIGTHQGIEIYSHDGTPQKSINLESVVAVCVYKFGFIVCQPEQLTIFRASMTVYQTIKRRRYHGFFRRKLAFRSLCDVTMTTQRDIAVLDSGAGKVYILDQDGYVIVSIKPRHETCGQLISPCSVAVDNWNSIYVSDTGSRRILKFSPQGVFSRCVLSFGLHTVPKDLQAQGLATTGDHLVAIVGGDKFAEVCVYTV